MVGFVLRRLAWAVVLFLALTLYTYVLFLALTLYTYVLFFVIPGNEEAIRRGVRGDHGTTLRETVGVDSGSIVREYLSFLSQVVHGDLGVSSRTNEAVLDVIARAAPVTLSLVVGGAVVWLLIAIPIGLLSARSSR